MTSCSIAKQTNKQTNATGAVYSGKYQMYPSWRNCSLQGTMPVVRARSVLRVNGIALLCLMSCLRKTFCSHKASIWLLSNEGGIALCINYLFKKRNDRLLMSFIQRGRWKPEGNAKEELCPISYAINTYPELKGWSSPSM